MGLLDVIVEMQSQGLGEGEIIENLRQQGFAPREIDEALGQLRIRGAVSQEYGDAAAPEPGQYAPEVSEGYAQGQGYNYSSYASQGVSSEMVGEIVDQAVSEKLSSLNKSISSLASLKDDFEAQVKEMDSRIKKLEENMEKLQHAIIGKIGEYGKDIKNVHTEMGAMQESFSKMLNPLMDKTRGRKRLEEEPAADDGEAREEKSSEKESGLEREHFDFDLLKKMGKK